MGNQYSKHTLIGGRMVAGLDVGLSLRRRRAWYADEPAAEPETPAAPEGEQAAPEPSAETQNTEPTQEHMIPKSRLDEVLARAKKAEDALAAQAKQAEEAEQARLKKQGEYQALYEAADGKAKTLEAKVTEQDAELVRYRERFQAMLTSRLEAAPEHIRALLDKMDALDALAWLDENADKLAPAKPTPPNTNARDGVRSSGSKEVALSRGVKL